MNGQNNCKYKPDKYFCNIILHNILHIILHATASRRPPEQTLDQNTSLNRLHIVSKLAGRLAPST